MPVAKKHNHTCPQCGKPYIKGCRSWQACGGKDGPWPDPCWECQKKNEDGNNEVNSNVD